MEEASSRGGARRSVVDRRDSLLCAADGVMYGHFDATRAGAGAVATMQQRGPAGRLIANAGDRVRDFRITQHGPLFDTAARALGERHLGGDVAIDEAFFAHQTEERLDSGETELARCR